MKMPKITKASWTCLACAFCTACFPVLISQGTHITAASMWG